MIHFPTQDGLNALLQMGFYSLDFCNLIQGYVFKKLNIFLQFKFSLQLYSRPSALLNLLFFFNPAFYAGLLLFKPFRLAIYRINLCALCDFLCVPVVNENML